MDHLYEGIVKENGQHEKPFIVRMLKVEHLSQILHVQSEILNHLVDNKTLSPLSEEEYRFILEGNGLMIGAFVNEQLIAFRALLIPEIDDEHLGKDIGLADDELSEVIYQEISNVLPAYRGNQLQKTLAKVIMEQLAKQDHGFRYVCCTVAPFNIPSLKDKFAQGMEIAALKEKYGGKMRYVFVKDLKRIDEITRWSDVTAIKMEDIDVQQAKIAEGFRGFKMEKADGTLWTYYGRCLN